MKQRGGCLWLMVGLFLAVIAGGLAFTAMLRASSTEKPEIEANEPRAPAVIVARDVPPRTTIVPEDLIVQELPLSAIPANAITSQDVAVGQVTTDRLIAGEILMQRRLAEPGKVGFQINFSIEPGKVVMSYTSEDLMSRTGILEPGDVIDFLFTVDVVDKTSPNSENNNEETEAVTFWALQKVTITAIVLPPEVSAEAGISRVKPQSILLMLDPQDALILKKFKDKNAIADYVLRSHEDDTEFDTVPVTDGYILDKFDINLDQLP